MLPDVFETSGWPADNIPPAQLRGMANYRDELGNEANAAGDYRSAEHHWRVAETYREQARNAAYGSGYGDGDGYGYGYGIQHGGVPK